MGLLEPNSDGLSVETEGTGEVHVGSLLGRLVGATEAVGVGSVDGYCDAFVVGSALGAMVGVPE